MGVLGLKLILETPWIGFPALAALILLTRIPRCLAAPVVLGVAAFLGWMTTRTVIPTEIAIATSLPNLVIPYVSSGRTNQFDPSTARGECPRSGRSGRSPPLAPRFLVLPAVCRDWLAHAPTAVPARGGKGSAVRWFEKPGVR